MTPQSRHFSLKILTINTHKGFTAFNRRFILPELRDAVRTVGADIVCLQEVMGAHDIHPLHVENWPDTSHYEFLADTMWSDYAYGRNAVYPQGHHGNAVLSRFPIEQVSWTQCSRKLTRYGLTLPTEAEWEYAARSKSPLDTAHPVGRALCGRARRAMRATPVRRDGHRTTRRTRRQPTCRRRAPRTDPGGC